MRISAHRNDLLTEINITDLATKKDLEIGITQLEAKMATKLELANLETRMYKHISVSKWQVIGAIGFFFFSTIIAKHIGLF